MTAHPELQVLGQSPKTSNERNRAVGRTCDTVLLVAMDAGHFEQID